MSRPAHKRSQLVPAAAMPPTRTDLSEADLALSDQAIASLETALGGRDALLDALQVAEQAPEVDRVVTMLLDARYDSWSLPRLCRLAGITVAELFAAYKRAAIVRAHLLATPIITQKIVGVIDDVLTRAQPHYVACAACRATGTVTPEPTAKVPNPLPQPCEDCAGAGQLLRLPDLDRQKLALEIADVLKPRAGITLNNQTLVASGQPVGGRAAHGSLDQLQQAVASVLGRRAAPERAPVEATIVDPAPEGEG